MISRGHDDDVARQSVNLKKQCRNHAFNFAGFVRVAALLADNIKFVEQKNGWRRTNVFEQPSQSLGSFAEIATDEQDRISR